MGFEMTETLTRAYERMPEAVRKVFDDWFRGVQVTVVQTWHDSHPIMTYFVVALETETRVLHCARIFRLGEEWALSVDSKTDLSQ